jgi:hypothetical protein
MLNHAKGVTLALVAALLLTACAKSETADVSQNAQASANNYVDGVNVWNISLIPLSDEYDSASPVCQEGWQTFSKCEFKLEVTNISKFPQTLDGILFLETSDGVVYQEDKPGYGSFDGVVNPGETVIQNPDFFLPVQGEVVTRIYRAWGATAEPIFTHTFETMWTMSWD